ncbi:MAG: phospho-N-acetylmuramoyl-pentapeptide-transferase [Candidatus Dependentiae bacterium]|nr:phospho-N-acetylmuramoyl-pentapeptide-transferase [Candidatus Dependentiae bacterium]
MFLHSLFFESYSWVARAVVGTVFGGLISVFFCWLFIRFGNRFIRAGVREFVTELHAHKDRTPTMGGLPLLVALFTALVAVGGLSAVGPWLLVAAGVAFGLLGLWDDVGKVRAGRGISEAAKFTGQLLVSSLLLTWMLAGHLVVPTVAIPFFGQVTWHVGVLFIPWALLVMIGTNNGVNITDGLDGLAASLLIINFAAFAVVGLLAGHGELVIVAMTACGVLAGFLWFNAHPAQLFMGDVGSLGFGGILATLALLLKAELLLPLTGIIFVVETLSVIAQVLLFRWYGRRLLRLAPLHHHFELSGVPETRIVARFVLITALVTIIALGLYSGLIWYR